MIKNRESVARSKACKQKTFLKNKPKKSPGKKKVKAEGEIDWANFYGFKCHFSDLIKQSSMVMSDFDQYTMNVLRHTSFYNFFLTIKEGRLKEHMVEKCCNSIYQLLKTYRHDLKGFVINPAQPKGVMLSPRLTALVFGISMKGSETESLEEEYTEECDMYSRFFKGKKSVSRKEIREAMEDLQRMKSLSKGDKVNLVKLLIMYSFSALFFSSTSSIVPKSMMAKFNSIKTLNNVCWPKEITQKLHEQVVRYRSKPKSVSGCVYLILYMLVEHTNVIDPLESEEDLFPRMLKWDLSKVTSDNWSVIQKNMLKAEVKVEIDDMSDMELKLIEEEEELTEVVVSDEEVEVLEGVPKNKESKKNPLDELCEVAFNETRDHVDVEEMLVEEENVSMENEELSKKIQENGDIQKKKERDERRSSRRKLKEKLQKKEKEAEEKKKRKKDKKVKSDKYDAEGAETSKDKRDSDHLMTDFPIAPVNEVEEIYGTDVYLDTLTDNVDELKYLLRRERAIREKFSMKCDYLDKLMRTREVCNSGSEGQKLKEEIVLLEETYKQALKSFNDESIRSDLYMERLIVNVDKLEKMYSQTVDELQKERADNKWCVDDARKSLKEQTDTIKACIDRELNLMHQVTELRNNLDKKDQDFERRLQVYQEKIESLEKASRGDNSEVIKELERVNSELEKENSELKRKATESEITIATNHDKIQILMNDKDRILEKFKKTANVAAENRVLRMQVDNLERQIKANATEPLYAIPITVVDAEMKLNDQTNEKEDPWSAIKTRSRKVLGQEVGKRKGLEQPLEPQKKKRKSSKNVTETKNQVMDLGINEQGPLQDPTKSPFWEELEDETKVKLQKLQKNGTRLTQVWYSEVPSVIDTVLITAVCLEDVYLDRYISAEVIDWYLIVNQKDYAPTTTQELRMVSLRAGAYDSWSNRGSKKTALDTIRMHIESKLVGGERYLLVPMRSSKSHWTLLYLDISQLQWHHYNSLGASKERMQIDFKAATQFRSVLQKFIQPVLCKLLNVGKVAIEKQIVRHESPRQLNGKDCGIFICLYAQRLAADFTPNFTKEDAVMMRTIWTNDILSHGQYSVDVNNTFDMLHGWMNSEEGRAAAVEDSMLAIENTPVENEDRVK